MLGVHRERDNASCGFLTPFFSGGRRVATRRPEKTRQAAPEEAVSGSDIARGPRRAPALYWPQRGGPERPARRCGSASFNPPAARAHPRSPAVRPVFTAVPGKGLMSEDERLEMVRTVAEAHAGLREIALRLRRRLPAKAPALKAALRAESGVFRLKRELQRLTLEDPEPARRRQPLPEVRQGSKVVDLERLRRGKLPDEEA